MTKEKRLILGEPFLKMSELDRAGLLQRTRGEPPHPVVMDAQSRRNGSVLPYAALDILPRPLDATFNGFRC